MTQSPEALYESKLSSLELAYRGKVRDVYAVDGRHLLIVTTDRISAFDVVMADPIPGKGQVLTAVSNFWFARMADLVPNHLADVPLAQVLPDPGDREQVAGRAVVVRRMHALPVEAIVRGYLIGSGWKDYQRTGSLCGIRLPAGLEQAQQLPEPIFTPSTKAELGQHDQNISFSQAADILGGDVAARIRDLSLSIYRRAAAYARDRGIIIADTKMEFGLDEAGRVVLIDELLTPDASRFWPADAYRTGISPPSFDKQFVRDYLESIGWDKRPPAPELPAEVVQKTAEKYAQAWHRLVAQ